VQEYLPVTDLSAVSESGDHMTKNRTNEILSVIRCKLSIDNTIEQLAETYRTAQPYPHLVLDGLFPTSTLQSLLAELPPLKSEKWHYESNERMSKYNFRSAVQLGESAFQFISTVHSAGFLRFLSEITGVEALLPDPYLTGAGFHVYPSGGEFNVHADRNMDFYCGLQRRLVMLIYLNRDWKESFGGQLELWDKDGTRCEKIIEPIFNRTVMFEIEDKNFHGVRPIVARDVFRTSLILYFHTSNSHLVPHESIFTPTQHRNKKAMIKRIGKEITPPFITKLAQRYVAKRW
jgi:hypothetical protein